MKKVITILLMMSVFCTMGLALNSEPVSAAHTHSYKVVKTKASTCKKAGYKIYKCKKCSAKKKVTLKKKAHSYKCYKTKSSTCTKNGTKYYKCKNCSAKKTTKIAKKSHSYKLYKTVEPTYSSVGYKYYKCSCGATTKKTIAKLSVAEGSKITLNKPQGMVFKEPLEEDFGEKYEMAMQFYNRLMANNDEELVIKFGSKDEAYAFNDLLEEKVLCGRYPPVGYLIVSGTNVRYEYTNLDTFYEDQAERVADEEYIYNCCKKAGLYNGMTERTAVKKMNTWICDNMSYKIVGGDFITAFKNKKGKCSHYALMFEAMCEVANIDCKFVSGHTKGGSSEGHAWNKVKIGSTWYWIDVCWNDTGGSRTKYLLSKTLWSSHVVD